MKPAKQRKAPVQGEVVADMWRQIQAITRTPQFENYLRDLLIELCRIDTTPNPKVQQMRKAEAACFDVIERELRQLGFAGCGLSDGRSILRSRRTGTIRYYISRRPREIRRA